MIQKDYEYIQGSAARQLQYDVYEENKVLKAKKRYRNNRKIKFRIVLSILSVLAAGLLVMYRFALITQLSYDINKVEKQYNELRNKNAILKVQIETGTNLTEIKELAESRLGMKKPDRSQIVYIMVPRDDYTVVMNSSDKESDGGGNIFKAVINKAAALIKLLE